MRRVLGEMVCERMVKVFGVVWGVGWGGGGY